MTDYPAWIKPATVEHCVAAGCRLKDADTPRFAVDGTELCNWHHARFPRILMDLATLWRPLEAAILRKPTRDANDRIATSGIKDVAALWNPAATRARYELTDWTGYLVRTILRERPTPPPEQRQVDVWDEEKLEFVTQTRTFTRTHAITGHEPIPVQLAALAKWHSRWLSSYPLVGASLLADALEHRQRTMLAIDSPGVRRVGIREAYCRDAIDEDDRNFCMGQMVGLLEEADTGRPSRLVCSVNPGHTTYLPHEWMAHA